MDTRKGTRTRGTVYFVQKGGPDGPVKIGWTGGDVTERVYTIGRQDETLVLGTIPGTFFTETQVHRLLDEDRLDGEWFKPTKRVLDAANGIGLEGVTGNEDPFDTISGRGTKTREALMAGWNVGENDYFRRQILGFYESGNTGFEAAEALQLPIRKLIREVRLMDEMGLFTNTSRLKRRRALKNVAANVPPRQMAA